MAEGRDRSFRCPDPASLVPNDDIGSHLLLLNVSMQPVWWLIKDRSAEASLMFTGVFTFALR